ncbi:MAG TPA: molybdate ABC transporter substrate-binding protein [Bryobacteraceae bacterium]|nr:molybdate ABC transporter substrate-binding protein [Bryobacteraceae bacterium]
MRAKFIFRPAPLLVLVAALSACHHQPPEGLPTKSEVLVGAAANLTDVFRRIGQRFESQTGIHPVFSFAATAQLAQQIEYAAPFDVFAAADTAHVQELDRKGLLLPRSRAVYVRGVLALWIPPHTGTAVHTIRDLVSPQVRMIAIANPKLAPYGEAAVEALQRVGIWERVKGKVVYAENINMARQYGSSKNADAVFTAYSLVFSEPGAVIRVEEGLHQPINQELAIVARAKNHDNARRFVDFLLSAEGKAILRGYGYATY